MPYLAGSRFTLRFLTGPIDSGAALVQVQVKLLPSSFILILRKNDCAVRPHAYVRAGRHGVLRRAVRFGIVG